MSQPTVVQVRGEQVKIDTERMMQLIAGGVDANTALLESIVEAVPGGQVCQLVGQNQFAQIYEDSGKDEKKAMEIFRQRNPKGYECMFGPEPSTQGTAQQAQEDPGNQPAKDYQIDAILGIIRKVDPSKMQEFQARLQTLGQNPTLNQVLALADSLVGAERVNAEMERRA